MTKLFHYDQEINKFDPKEASITYQLSLGLTEGERKEWENILIQYYESFSKNYGTSEFNYFTLIESMNKLKDLCDADWNNYMKRTGKYSPLNSKMIMIIDRSIRTDQSKESIISSLTRIGEFFYILDKEMEEISKDMETFINSGDCKLFDYQKCPYRDKPLCKSLEEDIVNKELQIREYLKDNSLRDISAKQILEALDQIKIFMDDSMDKVPENLRNFIFVCQEIRKEMSKNKGLFEDVIENGIPEEIITKKRSGFCLNKEEFFREFLHETSMSSWKNPEGSWLVGNSNYKFKEGLFKDTMYISRWDMDNIYYSLGKGPWLKTRYVGQPCPFYQNIAEVPTSIVKRVIKRIKRKFDNGLCMYNPRIVNIYDNFKELKEMIMIMKDSTALDYKSYSDYLSRNCFEWIMRYLLGIPKDYRDMIMHFMSLPIRVNGKTYYHLHGSVMGIKFNFLLITFANALMWAISSLISGSQDECKIMGDDRITVNPWREYTEEEFEIQLSVPAYFNCVINLSKTEWLRRDKYTSFCKRRFNSKGEQITGIGGEFGLKQKPFLNDLSVWLNVCHHNDLPVSKEDIDKWVINNAKYYCLTYSKFWHKGDPDLEEMIKVLKKIPFYYGGWSIEDADDTLEIILLRSVMATIDLIFEEMNSDFSDPALNRIREYIRYNGGDTNRYYLNLINNTSYSHDFEKIKEYADVVTKVITHQVNDVEDIKAARGASQRLMEIILQRDSRLAFSSSTKNRINYRFDQDRVAKIRSKYLKVAISEEENQLKASLIDSTILRESIKSAGGVPEYLIYLKARTETQSGLKWYSDQFNHIYVGMKCWRNGQEKIVRLETWDSLYDHYSKSTPDGKFLIKDDLSEKELIVYKMFSRVNARKLIKNITDEMNSVIESSVDYLIQRLIELNESEF